MNTNASALGIYHVDFAINDFGPGFGGRPRVMSTEMYVRAVSRQAAIASVRGGYDAEIVQRGPEDVRR